jgi:hypothetical protein
MLMTNLEKSVPKTHQQKDLSSSLLTIAVFTAVFQVLQQPANAAVDINIAEVGPDVVITAKGTINLPSVPLGTTTCGQGTIPGVQNGAINSSIASVCVGDGTTPAHYYSLTQPTTQSFGIGPLVLANSHLGFLFGIEGKIGFIGSNQSTVHSSSTFLNTNLASLGINQYAVLGTWTVSGTNDTITVRSTPGPLAALGLPITFGFTRKLRQRIRAAQKTTG